MFSSLISRCYWIPRDYIGKDALRRVTGTNRMIRRITKSDDLLSSINSAGGATPRNYAI